MTDRPSTRRAPALRWLILGSLLLLFFANGAAAQGLDPESAAAAPAATASVTLVRSSPSVQGCGLTTVDIWLNDVAAAYAADVRVKYDPATLAVVDANPSMDGTQIQPLNGFMKPEFVIRQISCNALDPADPLCDDPAEVGTIWYSFTQLNPTPPVSGSGALARITFRAVGPGLTPLDLTYAKVGDRNGVAIPVTQGDSELTAAPLAAPTVSISKLNDTTARLGWTAIGTAATYRIFRNSAPYFSPAEPAFGFTSGLSFEDTSALGSTAAEYFYIVKSACSDGYASAGSNRTGAWDYDLIPGS